MFMDGHFMIASKAGVDEAGANFQSGLHPIL
jgi:hypothetical protein